MRRLESLQFAGVLLACALFPVFAFPQDVPASQDNAWKLLTKREAKKREQKLSNELGHVSTLFGARPTKLNPTLLAAPTIALPNKAAAPQPRTPGKCGAIAT